MKFSPDMIAKINKKLENGKTNLNVDTNGAEAEEKEAMLSNAEGEFVPPIPAPNFDFSIPAPILEGIGETEVTSPANPTMSIQNIPAELKGLNHWVGFKIENGRKVPIDPKPNAVLCGLPAKINDPSTWGTFEEAATLVSKGLADAVGFAITKETGLIFVDFDCHVDSTSDLDEKKKIESFYASFAQQAKICDTYVETSVSGKGLHLLAKGKLLDEYGKDKAPNNTPLEIYDDMRFIVMTGQTVTSFGLSDSSKTIGFIHNLQKRYFLPASDGATSGTDFSGKSKIPPNDKEIYSDKFVLQVALKDEKFNLLWFDRWNEVKDKDGNPCYTHQHYADFALISKLIYYSHNCPSQAEKLFRLSPCYQAYGKNGKWTKIESDIKNDIKKASETCTAVYEVKPQVVVPPSIQVVDGDGNWKPNYPEIRTAILEGAIKNPKLKSSLLMYIEENQYKSINYIPGLYKIDRNVNGYTSVVVNAIGDKLIYSKRTKSFHLWDGKRFAIIEKEALYHTLTEILELIKHSVFMWVVTELMYIETMDANGIEKEQLEKEALEHLNWATKIVSIHNCDDILKKWIGMSFNYDIMEYTDHPYINLQNGVLDLRTRELLPHSTEYRQHKILNCEYDPQAICPTFDRMLETLVPDEEVRKELMKALGLTLTKAKLLPGSKSLFLLIGKKDSGKTTFINAINNVLGDFGVNIDNSLLMQGYKSSSNIGPELITLYDARLVSTSELSQDARLNSAKVKAMTGNNVLTTRNLFDRSMFSFIFRGQIWIDSNYKPVIENDEAMWGRVRIFPFNQVIKSKDRDIYEKLEAEKAGILNRLLEAMAQVEQEDGEIYECEAMLEAKNDYKIEVTPTDQFVDECLIITKDSQDRIELPKMYQTYQNWAEDFGYRAMNKSRFYAEISNYSERKKSYSEYFGGVKLTTVGTLYYHKKEMSQQEFARQKRKLVESHDSELTYTILRDQFYQKSKEWFRENIGLIALNTDIYNDNHNKYPLYADWCIEKGFVPLKSSDFNIKCVYIKDHFTKEHYNKVELIQRLLNEADNLWAD